MNLECEIFRIDSVYVVYERNLLSVLQSVNNCVISRTLIHSIQKRTCAKKIRMFLPIKEFQIA